MLDVSKSAKRVGEQPTEQQKTADGGLNCEACDAKQGRPMLWMPMQTPHGIPRYYRMGAGKYSLRRVMIPVAQGEPTKMERRWALFCKESRVSGLPAVADRDEAMEQAEEWLVDNGIVIKEA